jgi:hypothetical protein
MKATELRQHVIDAMHARSLRNADVERESGVSRFAIGRLVRSETSFVSDDNASKIILWLSSIGIDVPNHPVQIAESGGTAGMVAPVYTSRRTVGVYGRANCAVAPRWGDTIPDGDDVPQVDLPDVLEKYKRAAAFRAADESMAPTIHDGDLIFFSPDAEKANGCVVVVKWRDTVYCKRWYPSNSHVTLTSDAPGIPPLVVPGKEIEWAYRAVLVRSEKKL